MHASTVAKMEIEPLLVSIPQTGQIIARGTSKVYELIGAGVLDAVKSDARTLVTMASIKRYVATLQTESPAKVAPQPKRKPQHLRQTSTASSTA
jgi:hypothetical protein